MFHFELLIAQIVNQDHLDRFLRRCAPSYLKDLCQLHLLVVEDGVDAVDGLFGLVGRAPLGLLV